ncbi:MAG: GNAT family N-acetyltransferase [Synechococcaceae cyanobacterium RL_1_2]|nr:GNAT family N-acetyltransferase [Synechococcaceae cyanobacterium RL_1_2]
MGIPSFFKRVRVRPAHLEDLDDLTNLLVISFHSRQSMMGWLSGLFKISLREDLRHRLGAGYRYYRCLLAIVDGETDQNNMEILVGTAEVTVQTNEAGEKQAYIANFAVHPAYRRQGIGTKLLQSCEEVSKEWGFDHISLHTLDSNQQAQQLYRKRGYQVHRIEYRGWGWLWRSRSNKLFLKKFYPCQKI